MEENRIYIAIDLKSFYASVECVERGLDPLAVNLVVADSSRTEKTICLAVSPSLKAYGIPGRARLFEVVQKVKEVNAQGKRKAPKYTFLRKSFYASELASNPVLELDYIVAPPRMARYMEVSSKIYNICNAITSVFPKTKNQLCIVHQIRNSCKFVPYKDRKAVCADLKKIYGAVNLEDAEYAKEEFREKWDKRYPNILKSWDKNWAELTTFFEYPHEIRRIIYTTNAVESYHRMVRKFTKSKAIFPTDDSIRKVIYMSVTEISKKWTMPVWNWGMAYAQFAIFFEDRFAA